MSPRARQQQAGRAVILAGFLPAPGPLLLIAPIPSISTVMNLVPVKHTIAPGGLASCPMSGSGGGGH